jgi:ankyrin repeat protein
MIILMYAVQKGYIELVDELLARDAWVNHEDNDSLTPLHYAIDNISENLDIVNLLIDNGANLNRQTASDGQTPLILAVNCGHVNIVRQLIEKGANLDVQDYTGLNTALHIACQKGYKEIVEILATDLTFPQIFDKKNRQGQRAIDIAEEKVMDFEGGLATATGELS